MAASPPKKGPEELANQEGQGLKIIAIRDAMVFRSHVQLSCSDIYEMACNPSGSSFGLVGSGGVDSKPEQSLVRLDPSFRKFVAQRERENRDIANVITTHESRDRI